MDRCRRPQFSTDTSDVVTRGWGDRTGGDGSPASVWETTAGKGWSDGTGGWDEGCIAFLGDKINQILALTSAGPTRLRGLHRCRAGATAGGDLLPGEGAQLAPVPPSRPVRSPGAPVPPPRCRRAGCGCSPAAAEKGRGRGGEQPPIAMATGGPARSPPRMRQRGGG